MTPHILHAYKSYWPDPTGGVAEVIRSIVAACDGFENTILVARTKGWTHKFSEGDATVRAVASAGEFSSLPLAPSYPFAFSRAASRADLVVQHVPFPLADLALLRPLPKSVPLVVYWHAELVRRPFVIRAITPLLRHTLDRADCIVVSHEAVLNNSSQLAPYRAKCKIIPYAVDAEYWSSLHADLYTKVLELRARYPKLIAAAGRLVPYKGFDILLDAMQHVDAQLAIIGTGPLQQALELLISKNRLQDRVVLLGHQTREQMKILFHAARAFAFPSLTPAEAFGLVQLEAMSCSLPIVNTALRTAVPHIARDGREAITVSPGNPAELAWALNTLIGDPEGARRLGMAALDRARGSFSPASFRSQIRELFQRLTDR